MKSTSLYSRKVLIGVGVIALLVFVIVQFVVVLDIKLDQSNARRHAQQQQDKFNNLSKAEQAISKGEANLKGSITKIDSAERLFIAYLQRRFDLSKDLDANTYPINIPQDKNVFSLQIQYLARMAYPDKILDTLPPSDINGAVLTNIYAANCDVLPLPPTFWQSMEENHKAGGYSLTHVLLALAFMKDNGCSIPSYQQDLSSRTSEAMVKLMDNPETTPDMRYEIVAFLQLAGRYEMVKSEWIDQIVSEQLTDGGWLQKKDDRRASNHTTVLALWALLQYSRPDKTDEPLVHRSTER